MELGGEKTENNNQTPFIQVEKLGCKSGHRYLLRDINWKVVPGEHWLVFGMNGSGKTTLLSIISGFKQHTEGRIELFGKEISNDTIMENRKKIGFISASFFGKVYGNESARTIVLSGLTGTFGLDGLVPLDADKKAYQLLEAFHLEDRADYPFYMFSKGEQQSILIARALINDPTLLILDEPYTGLDIYNREYIADTIAHLGERKDLTIIYVTHYVEEITPLFENTLLLKNGMAFRQGKTKDLFTSEIFSEYLEHKVDLQGSLDKGYSIKLTCNTDLTHKIS